MKKNTALGIGLAIIAGYAVYAGFTRAQIASPAASSPSPAKTKIPILIYHSVRPYYPGITDLVKEYTVPPDIFDEQLKYMKDNGFSPISPDDLVSYFVAGKTLPPKPFMITLDDGWENQFRYAFPILEKNNDPAVFYVYTNVVGRKVFLSWSQIKTLAAANMIIGDHTESHPELPKVTSDAALNQEVADSKKIIEAELGKAVDSFAYPFGEYNQKDVDAIKKAGYASARTVNGCVYQSSDMLFTLCGSIITGDFNRFVSIVNR